MDRCGSGTAYRHGKTYEECKQLAEDFTAQLKPKIDENGKLMWSSLLETVNHDEKNFDGLTSFLASLMK